MSYNEDVEVGRCVSKMLKLQCTWSWEVSKVFIYDLMTSADLLEISSE